MNENHDKTEASDAAATGAVRIRIAARKMGVSVALIRSWLNDPEKRDLYIPNAFKGGSGALTSPWFFPMSDIERYNRMSKNNEFARLLATEEVGNVAAA